MSKQDLRIWLGSLCKHTRPCADTGVPFFVTEEFLNTHLSIFGGTRQGKSKLYEQILRELIRLRRGFCFIDPHSDTADDVLAYLAQCQEELGLRRLNVHYLNPFEKLFSFDPFFYQPHDADPVSFTDVGYFEWLHVKVLDVQRIITRVMGETEADMEKQVRLNRWMRTILYAIGIRHDRTGKHFGLEEALILLTPTHERYAAVVETVLPLLNTPHTQPAFNDLMMISGIRDHYRREQWVESTINRLRNILSPIIRRIFQPRAERLNFRSIIASNGIVIAALGKRERFHSVDGKIIAGLIIREIADAVVAAERSQRQRYYLFIDEAQHFIGEDLEHLFKESGKYKLSVCLAIQSLNNLLHGDIDLTETVLGMCDTRITFRQQHFPVAQLLAKDLGHPLLEFTPLVHKVQQHAGYDYIVNESVSFGATNGESQQVSFGRSQSRTNSQSHSLSSGWAEQTASSLTTGSSHSVGHSTGVQRGLTQTTGSQGDSAGLIEQFMSGVPSTKSSSQSLARSESQSQSESTSRALNESQSLSESHSTNGSESFSSGSAESNSTSVSEATGQSQSVSATVTLSRSPLAKYKLADQQTGQLRKNVDIQDRDLITTIQQLPKQHCLVCVGQINTAAVVRIADVHDPYEQRGVSQQWREGLIAGFKKFIFERHAYYFDREPALNEQPPQTVADESFDETQDEHFAP